MSLRVVYNVTIITLLLVFLNILGISKYSAAQGDAIIFPGPMNTRAVQHHHHDFSHHHHHHYHTAEFHNMGNEDDSDEMFDESRNASLIPLDFIERLNSFTDVNDLLLNFVDGGDFEPSTLLTNRFGDTERHAAVVPKSANCIPELQTVKITPDDDPSIIYIPACTRVERCGGCCSHALLSCQPKETESVSFQVMKTQFTGGSKLKFVGKEIIVVEKHTKCKCDCRIQETDCTSLQVYRKGDCRCACMNTDEEKKCYKENGTKLWNPDICTCQCRNILECSTGYVFSTTSCKCTRATMRRRFANLNNDDKPDQLENLPPYQDIN